MVCLVNVFVKKRMVEEPGGRGREGVNGRREKGTRRKGGEREGFQPSMSLPVGVVEANLLKEDVHEQVPDSGGERWEGVATFISFHA